MSEQSQSPPRLVVYRSTQRRTFKACRTCRQQKARCIGAENPPCKRCQATGRDCVFEELGVSNSRKRQQPATPENESGSKRPSGNRIHDLENEVAHLRSLANNIRATPIPGSSRQPRTNRSGSAQSRQDLEHDSLLNERQDELSLSSVLVEDAASSSDLALMHLDAPITAVQAMSMTGLPPSPSSVQSQDSTPSHKLVPRYSSGRGTMETTPQKPTDVVSAGLITEFEARKLFQLYMANANVFLPVFDPAVDSFDAVRQSSTFCLTVILAIALRAEHPDSHSSSAQKGHKCFLEAQNLATESLFASFARLETIQGMLLLAAYSDKNWFAVSHAYQTSRDMGLHDAIYEEHETSRSVDALRDSRDRRLVRRTRTALILHHVEQEVASGTTRPSKGRPVKGNFMKGFLGNRFLNTYDMRIVANVEIVQLRGRLLKELEIENSLIGTVHQRVQTVEEEINRWFNHWESVFQGQDISVGCFQRSSIRLQRDYAFIIICSAIISKLSNGLVAQTRDNMLTEEMHEIVELTFERSVKILGFIAENNDYKWYLQWAPTYSALFPAFTAALAFRLAKMRLPTTDWDALQSSFIMVADILEDYPYRHFSMIIRDLSSLCSELSRSQRAKSTTNARRTWRNAADHTQSQALGPSYARPENDTSNAFRPNDESHNQAETIEEEIQITTAPSNADDDASTSGFGTGDVRSCWIPDPTPHFTSQDNNLGPEQLDMQSLLTTPDYIFDFNLFATSMQSSMDDTYFPGRAQQ